jgi:hypothetical protein
MIFGTETLSQSSELKVTPSAVTYCPQREVKFGRVGYFDETQRRSRKLWRFKKSLSAEITK